MQFQTGRFRDPFQQHAHQQAVRERWLFAASSAVLVGVLAASFFLCR